MELENRVHKNVYSREQMLDVAKGMTGQPSGTFFRTSAPQLQCEGNNWSANTSVASKAPPKSWKDEHNRSEDAQHLVKKSKQSSEGISSPTGKEPSAKGGDQGAVSCPLKATEVATSAAEQQHHYEECHLYRAAQEAYHTYFRIINEGIAKLKVQ